MLMKSWYAVQRAFKDPQVICDASKLQHLCYCQQAFGKGPNFKASLTQYRKELLPFSSSKILPKERKEALENNQIPFLSKNSEYTWLFGWLGL